MLIHSGNCGCIAIHCVLCVNSHCLQPFLSKIIPVVIEKFLYRLGIFDDFSDILAKDTRFDSRAYDFVLQVIAEASADAKGHVTGQELLDYFRDLALDAYGPMAYTVLTDWGIHSCEDVGTIVFNLYDTKRIGKTDSDSPADFIGGFDFKEEFLGPYKP